MARRPRNTKAGTRVPAFHAGLAPKFVDEANWAPYHRRWREIDQTFPVLFDRGSLTDGSNDAVQGLREFARAALRAELRAAVSTGRAMFLIPV